MFGDPDESRKGTPVPKNTAPAPVVTEEEEDAPPRKIVVTPPKPLSSNPKQVPWPSDVPNSKEKFRVKLSLRINAKGTVSKKESGLRPGRTVRQRGEEIRPKASLQACNTRWEAHLLQRPVGVVLELLRLTRASSQEKVPGTSRRVCLIRSSLASGRPTLRNHAFRGGHRSA